jgi:hypothetical protein
MTLRSPENWVTCRMARGVANTSLFYSAIWVALLVHACAPRSIAQEPGTRPAVEAGREALRESASFPWYDPERDDLRDLNAPAKKAVDAEIRKTGWEREPAAAPNAVARPRTTSSLAGFLQAAAMALLVLLLCGLSYLLVRYFVLQEEAAGGNRQQAPLDDRSQEADRVEQLPFHVRRTDTDLLSEARRLYEQQRYEEAIVYLFSYQLVELDKHQHIHLAKGKTNRQYLRELRQHAALQGMVQRSMIAFEEVFFGRHRLDRDRFEQAWQQLPAFQQALQPGVAA